VPRRRDEDSNWPKLIQLGAGATQFGMLVAGGALGGYWFDTEFDSAPWGTLIGIAGGSIAAFRMLYFIAKRMSAGNDDRGQGKDSQ